MYLILSIGLKYMVLVVASFLSNQEDGRAVPHLL